jgi:hypothetical protein
MTERGKRAALAPTLHADVEHTRQPESPEQPEQQIEQTRKSIGCGAIATLCLGMAASGAVGTMSYLYITKQPPFAPLDVNTAVSAAPAPSSAPDSDAANMEKSEPINSNQDLKNALKKHKIAVAAQDFAFETERPELQAKALYMTSAAAADHDYDWRPVRERITRTGQPELLVAVRVLNPNLGDNVYEMIVPEGLSYRAKARDPHDPSIIYFYYHCADKKGQSNLLAQLGIKDPQKPRRLLWGKSFLISDCPE